MKVVSVLGRIFIKIYFCTVPLQPIRNAWGNLPERSSCLYFVKSAALRPVINCES